jgi:hypothetical protein
VVVSKLFLATNGMMVRSSLGYDNGVLIFKSKVALDMEMLPYLMFQMIMLLFKTIFFIG